MPENPNQTLGQRYNSLIQAYKDTNIGGVSASMFNYDMQDIESPGTHLGLGEKDLVYCILANSKYKSSFDTIIPKEIAFIRFISSMEQTEIKTKSIQELISHPLNQDLKNKLKDFLNGPQVQERLVIANSSLNNLNDSHVISIQMEKVNKRIKITFLDSVGTFEENGQLVREPGFNDIWQNEVISGLISSCDPKLGVDCDHPPVNPQASANCLIEALNKQVAYDLKCRESNLTPEDVKEVRLKVNQALHLTLAPLQIDPQVQVIESQKPTTPKQNLIDKKDVVKPQHTENPVLPKLTLPPQEPQNTPQKNKKKEAPNNLPSPQEQEDAHKQLLQLTKEYLQHLFREANKLNLLTVSFDSNNPPILSDTCSGKAEKQANYQAIYNKYLIVSELLATLNQKDSPCSKTILDFNKLLTTSHVSVLKQHRDPNWMHYFKNSMVLIGIILTGVIPGVVGLLSYAVLNNKSSILFFSKSHGEEYVDKSVDLVTKHNP